MPDERERWLPPLFLALALVQLVPVWSALYFPTTDGPAHVYNAFVIRQLLLHRGGAIAQTYAIDWRPHPNLLCHTVLAALLGIVSPAVAEKILVSAIVLLFLGGTWLFAGAVDRRACLFAFLALPLVHHQFLQYGFYNFAISVGLYLVIVALWWQRRDRPDWQTITIVAILTLLCYTAHPSSTVFVIATIVLCSLTDWRRRAKHLLAFVPVLPLLIWFFVHQRSEVAQGRFDAWQRLLTVVQTRNLLTFDERQLWLGTALFVTLITLIVVTIVIERWRREAGVFLAVFVAAIVVYAVAPARAAGGLFVRERIALFLPLLALPWLTPRLPRAMRLAFAVVLSVVASGNAWFLAIHDRNIARETTAIVRVARNIERDRTMLPLIGDRRPAGTFLSLLSHATAYAAIDRSLVDLDNFEASTGYFPVRFRDGAARRAVFDIEGKPGDIDADAWAPLAQYVFTWHLPADAPVFPRLERHYELVAVSDEARIYRRRGPIDLSDCEELLLPISGPSVDHVIANHGSRDVIVSLKQGDVAIRAGETRTITSNEPFLVARLPRNAARDVTIKTTRDGVDVPTIPIGWFHPSRLDLFDVATSAHPQLRLWIYGETPRSITMDVRSESSAAITRRTIAIDPHGYYEADLQSLLPGVTGHVRLHIDSGAGTRLWAIVIEPGTIRLPEWTY